jgi:uncharacterized protein YdhG (YjbR/CyaY superfamily)
MKFQIEKFNLMLTVKPNNTDEYIEGFPKNIQKVLKQMRATIKEAAPGATEVISYSMPAFKLNGVLVWFAAYSKHIGFYPGADGINTFKKEFASYKWAKGSVQFPLDQPMPLSLITKIVKYRVKQDLEKAELKKQAKKTKR